MRIIVSAFCAVLCLIGASTASAQGSGQVRNGDLLTGARSMSAALVDPRSSPIVSALPTRLDRQRRRNGVYQQAPTMVEVMSDSQSQINTANVDCRVVDASLLGFNAQQEPVYEVSCGTGMGYVLGASSPPTVTDCITIASRADMATRADPAAKPLVCKLTANQNVTGMVANYARQAGIACPIDQAAMAGTSISGNAIYEVGCEGADGYWLEKASTGWLLTPCLKVASLENACRFSTREEQAASLKTWLAGTPGSACDVTNVRYMGANASDSFYEAKCGVGVGYVARLNASMTVEQVYTCAQAAGIGGGCKLNEGP